MRRLYTDGASKGNGSKGQRAYVAVYDESRRQIVVDEAVGNRTNNEAEFIAVMRALDYAIAQGMTGDVCIVTDSQLTCNQILGLWKVKAEHLRPMVLACQRKLQEARAEITWVPREQNHAGHYIERRHREPAGPAAGPPAGAGRAERPAGETAPLARPAGSGGAAAGSTELGPGGGPRPRPAGRPLPPSLRRTVPYWRRPDAE